MAAKDNGFCVIPLTKYGSGNNIDKDYQLNLVENYLLLLRYTNDMKSKNNIDFGFLTQKLKLKKQDSSISKKTDSSKDKSSPYLNSRDQENQIQLERYNFSSGQKEKREERDNYSFGNLSLDNV